MIRVEMVTQRMSIVPCHACSRLNPDFEITFFFFFFLSSCSNPFMEYETAYKTRKIGATVTSVMVSVRLSPAFS